MPSTTAIGDALRDYVIGLLLADGQKVEREVRLGTKKIDVLLTLSDSFSDRKIAIECKNLARSLGQSDINSIYSDHRTLIDGSQIDEIWVIARRDFSPDAKNYARGQRGINVFTLSQFEERQHGFNQYSRQIKGIFEEDDLKSVYVPQKCADGRFLFDIVKDWLNDEDDERPMAILGGYGMGKSSFCKYLVDKTAEIYLNDAQNRVPVYIRLSDIAKQQELDGLISKTLADRYRIKDYYFNKFTKFNYLGKFFVIFDGFDEMKHGLSWPEFKYNFSEINKTVRGKAKVLVAGRPNAFLSDAEHDWALKGLATRGERAVKMPDWPEYYEVEMTSFSVDEARKFLTNSLAKRIEKDSDIAVQIADFDFKDATLLRPVHLKIFAQILRDEKAEMRSYNTYELYEMATSQVSMREGQKIERAHLDSEKRQLAIEEVAWWLWENKSGRSLRFNPSEVPYTIIRRPFDADCGLNDEEKSRELFSSSFLERKHGESFYFAHRSFLEFFIARKLIRASNPGLSLNLINQVLNPEIFSFISESGEANTFLDYVLSTLQRFSGEIELFLLNAAVNRIAERNNYFQGSQTSVQMAARYLNVYLHFPSGADLVSLIGRVIEDCNDINSERAHTAVYYTLDNVRLLTQHEDTVILVRAIVSLCVAAVDWSAAARRLGSEADMPRTSFSRDNPLVWCLFRNARFFGEKNNEDPILVVDVEKFFFDLDSRRRPKIVLSGRTTSRAANGNAFKLPSKSISIDIKGRALENMHRVLSTPLDPI